MKHIFKDIKKERERQNKKWGEQNHNPVEWMAILTEEVGEASKEALEFHFAAKELAVSLQENRQAFYDKLLLLRKELVQTAAVAVSMIESLERNEFVWSEPKNEEA